MIERSDALKLMDQLEALLMKKGWPIPMTPFYLVDHEKMLALLDHLRLCLQDEMDGRFIKTFAEPEAERKKMYKPTNKGKERRH